MKYEDNQSKVGFIKLYPLVFINKIMLLDIIGWYGIIED